MYSTTRTILQSWFERKLPEVTDRDIKLSVYVPMRPGKIIAITGFRRVGKTYLLFQLIKELLKKMDREDIIYINFDDERIPRSVEFLSGLLPVVKELSPDMKFLFLDEIQEIPAWSRWLRRVYDTEDTNIFVTGSSSKMSSREIPTELRGRALEIRVFPLSFREFLRFKGEKIDFESVEYSEKGMSRLRRLVSEYAYYGGMPEVVLSQEPLKFDILQQYYATVVRRDIIERYGIKNEEGMKALLRLLLNSTQYSVSRLYNTMKSMGYEIGKSTLQNYLGYIESSYFIQSVFVFSPKVKDQMQYPRKVYFIDNGFISALSTRFSKNTGRLYENMVAVELMRRYTGVEQEIHYWKDSAGKEVDFVVKDGMEIKELIQVSYDVGDPYTRKRELSGLYRASNDLGCGNLTIVTENEEGVEEYRGKEIRIIPMWKWISGIPPK